MAQFKGWDQQAVNLVIEKQKMLTDAKNEPIQLFPIRKKGRARLPRHTRGEMNKTETRFRDEYIKPRLITGEYLQYWFESITLVLADDCRYTPDFMVMTRACEVLFFEVKPSTKNKQGKQVAFSQDDSKVKVKVAPMLFPFDFSIAFPTKEGWVIDKK